MHRQVMAAEGMAPDPDDMIVTTGGQQAIDLITKTLVDPGDAVICEAPTYPGAVPIFCSYEAEVIRSRWTTRACGSTCWRSCSTALDADGRRPKFIYTVPTFQNPAGVTLSAQRRQPPGELARERELLVSRTTPTACSATRASRCRRSTRSTAATTSSTSGPFSKILSPGHPARLGRRATAGAGEDQARQAGRRPLHLLR